ncbi:MAG TPA: hypothetical protein VGL06_19425 [Pseudonocardiaceae bacterium]
MIRQAITIFTFLALLAAMAACVLWIVVSPNQNTPLDPIINILVISSALTGIFAERWAGARQHRSQALNALATELHRNAALLDADLSPTESEPTVGPTVYPRLLVSAADTALVSGALDRRRDSALLSQLHGWRDTVYGVNQRLDLTELLMFSNNSPMELRNYRRALHSEGSYLSSARQLLAELTAEVSARLSGL